MKRLFALLLALVMVLSLAACGGNAGPAASPDAPAADAPAADAPAAAAPTEELQNVTDLKVDLSAIPEAAAYKEELVIAENSAITSLDPHANWSYQTNQVYRMVYDTLLTYSNGEYGPRIATEWKWVDGTTLNVKIRDDVYFTNGEKLTAEDVAFSMDRATYSSVTKYYDHCEVISDTELNIVLSSGCTEFLYFLADTSTAIVSKAAVEADPEWGYVIASGPWVLDLEQFIPGDSLVMLRNDNYWGQKPNTKKFTIRIMSDNSVALMALQNGEIDFVPTILSTEVEMATADTSIDTVTYASSNIEYIAMNTVNGGSLTDPNLRKAVAYAIDRDQIRIAAGQDTAKLAGSMWGWASTGYYDGFDSIYSYNPEKAREYVALVEDPSFTIMVNGATPAQKVHAQMIQAFCADVGITVEINETDAAGISANTKWGAATHEMLVYNISLSDSNTSSWEFYMTNAGKNRAFCSDERVQELLVEAAAAEDNYEMYKEIQEINLKDLYYIPLYYRNITVSATKGMGGVILRMAGGHDFTYACVPVNN